MAKTDRKNSKKIFEGYRKHQKLWNGIFIVLFAVIGIGLAIANGTVDWNPQLVIGRYEFTLFHAIMLVVMVVLLGFGIVAIKRDSSEEQQDFHGAVVIQQVTQVGDLAVHEGAAGIAVQAHAQILGKVGDGLRGGQLSYGAVLQGDFQHNNSSVSGNG